jgi:hypothetical protein
MAFDKLRNTKISVLNYQGELKNVVFDMATAESFIAGIADQVLGGQPIAAEHRSGIAQEVFNGTAWLSTDGERFDLTASPELLEYAQAIDDARKACVNAQAR